MKHTNIVFISLLALGACHGSGEPAPTPAAALTPAPTPPPPPAAQAAQFGAHRSPVTVKLVGPAQVSAGQDIEVVADVEQLVGSQAAVELSLVLPEGARLISGSAQELLPTGNGKLQRRFLVHLDRVPATDIEVVAKTNSSSFGARAKSAYRFGRPEPRFTELPRSASPLSVGGKGLGHPIELKPKSP